MLHPPPAADIRPEKIRRENATDLPAVSQKKKGKHSLKNSEGSENLRATPFGQSTLSSFSIFCPLAFQRRYTLSGGNPCAHGNRSCLPSFILTRYGSNVISIFRMIRHNSGNSS